MACQHGGIAFIGIAFPRVRAELTTLAGTSASHQSLCKYAPYAAVAVLLMCQISPMQVTTTNLEKVRKQKTRHQRLFNRVLTVREELERYLEDDDDMMKMCLTRKKETEAQQPGKQPAYLCEPCMRYAKY